MAEKRERLKKPLQLSALIESAFAGKPLQQRLREGKVWEIWQEAVGQQIAAKARPAAFRNGVLTVFVSSSAWLQQLSLMKAQVMENINEAAGEQIVNDIFFKHGSMKTAVTEEMQAAPRKPDLSPEKKCRLEKIAEPIEDPELRSALISLISASSDDSRKGSH